MVVIRAVHETGFITEKNHQTYVGQFMPGDAKHRSKAVARPNKSQYLIFDGHYTLLPVLSSHQND